MKVAGMIRVVVLLIVVGSLGCGSALFAEQVQLTDVVVTRAWAGYFYVQRPNWSGATRVEVTEPHWLVPGDVVNILGESKPSSYEPCIIAQSIVAGPQPMPIRPLGMRPADLPGYTWWYNPETQKPEWGPRALIGFGLYSTVWGRVTEVDPTNNRLYLDDGAMRTNYGKTHVGVRADLDPDLALPPPGDFVVVWGICTGYPDETTGDPLPRILVQNQQDILIH